MISYSWPRGHLTPLVHRRPLPSFQPLQGGNSRVPWFVREWRVPLNRCIYTAFSYMMFLVFIILYVAETPPPLIYWVDVTTATWIISYTCRDMGTGRCRENDLSEVIFSPFSKGRYSYIDSASTHFSKSESVGSSKDLASKKRICNERARGRF